MFKESKENVTRNTTDGLVSETVITMTKYVGQAGGANLLGMFLFAENMLTRINYCGDLKFGLRTRNMN